MSVTCTISKKVSTLSIYTQPPCLMNVIVSATVAVCTCLTSLIYSIVVLLLVIAEYRVHTCSVVVRTQDVSTRSNVHTRECVCTVAFKYVYSRVYTCLCTLILHTLHRYTMTNVKLAVSYGVHR